MRVPHGVRSGHVTYTQCEPTSGCAEPAALAAAPSSSAVQPGATSIASVARLRLAIAWCTRASSLATRGGKRAGSSTRTGSIVTDVTSSSQYALDSPCWILTSPRYRNRSASWDCVSPAAPVRSASARASSSVAHASSKRSASYASMPRRRMLAVAGTATPDGDRSITAAPARRATSSIGPTRAPGAHTTTTSAVGAAAARGGSATPRANPAAAASKGGQRKHAEFRTVRSRGQPHAIVLAMARALGRYELLRPLARGGMAEVYLARRRAAGIEKWLVVKRMRPERSGDPRFLDLFVREARLSMSLVHQNIVPVFDFGRIDDEVFHAMERVEGRDLGSSLAASRGHRLPPLLAAFIAAECCQALDYAHQRDVTPRNVL